LIDAFLLRRRWWRRSPASEAVGTVVTGAMLAGAGSQNSAVVPMGSEEVSALANAIAAHTANFLAMTGVALAQRGLFAAQVRHRRAHPPTPPPATRWRATR